MSDDELSQLTQAYRKAMQTPIQKSGGKIDYLVNKYKTGGDVSVKVEDTPKKAKKAAENNTSKAPNVGKATHRREGASVDRLGGQHLFMDEIVGGNSAEATIDIPQPGDTLVNQKIYTRNNAIHKNYLPGTSEYESVMSRARRSPYLQGILASIRKTLGF